MIVVTHGKPANRCPVFNEALARFGQWDEKFFECELSFQAQFINIVRSTYPGESMAAVIKDPTKLSQCLKNIAAYKDKKEVSAGGLRQSNCWVYIYTRIN